MKPETRPTAPDAETNLRGGASGAGWRLLLPSPGLERMVIVGTPSPADLRALTDARATVYVLPIPGLRGQRRRRRIREGEGVHPVSGERLPAGDGEVDAVVVLGRRAVSLLGHPDRRRELERVMSPHAVIYVQHHGRRSPLPAGAFPGRTHHRLRIGTSGGELRWAAPAADAAAVAVARSLGADPAGGGVRGAAARLLARARSGFAPRASAGELFSPRRAGGPPRYIRRVAEEAGVTLDGRRWAMAIPGTYASNKAIFLVFPDDGEEPDLIVKVARRAAQAPRLENEDRVLTMLGSTRWSEDRSSPSPLFSGMYGGTRILGETAISGEPFRVRTTAEPDCPYARAVVDRLVELVGETAEPADPSEHHERLTDLLGRYRSIYRPDVRRSAFLQRQVESIGGARLPVVFQHGDPGTWNIRVRPDGSVGFLDWEAGDPRGVPLWDLFYFLRSFGVTVSRAHGIHDSLRAFERQYLERTDLAAVQSDAVRRACDATGVPPAFVEPLFHTCWMHRAVKQASRLPRRKLRRGHYERLLRAGIDGREAPGLTLLFGGG